MSYRSPRNVEDMLTELEFTRLTEDSFDEEAGGIVISKAFLHDLLTRLKRLEAANAGP